MLSKMDHQTPPTRCTNCNGLLDGATGVGHDHAPTPGSVTVCAYCGHLMAYDDNLAMRELTGDEIVELAGDRHLRQAMMASYLFRMLRDKHEKEK